MPNAPTTNETRLRHTAHTSQHARPVRRCASRTTLVHGTKSYRATVVSTVAGYMPT